MLNIITRASKGFPLTNAEMDQNLDSLRNAVDTKAESVHGHNIQDVANLQSILDTKAASAHAHPEATVSVAGLMSSTDKNKLDGIAAGATANSSDSALQDRSTHTGVQNISTISGLADALDTKVNTSTVGFANGVASLDANGKVPISQIPITPSAVDSVAGKTGVVTLVPADITGLDAALASKADNNVALTDAAGTATLPATAAAPIASRLHVLRNNVKQAFADLGNKLGTDFTSLTVRTIDGTETLALSGRLKATVQAVLNWVLGRANIWTGNQTFNTGISTGDVRLKIKHVTVTAGTYGTNIATAAHGLTRANVVGFTAVMEGTTASVLNQDFSTVYVFSAFLSNTTCGVQYSSSTATEVYGKPVRFLIWYT